MRIFLIMLALSHFVTNPVAAGFSPEIMNKSSILVVNQNTGIILYEKAADERRYPASITKLMTTYIAFKYISEGKLKLSDKMLISTHAANQDPVKLGLKPGTYITVDHALKAAAIKSCNDATVVLAEKIAGSESNFALLMNKVAKQIGMTKTSYANASGLPNPNQISSAYDIAKLAIAIQRDYPALYHNYYRQKNFVFNGRKIETHNHILKKLNFPGKTGFTCASGHNLVTNAHSQDGRKIIAVVLGEGSARARDHKMSNLLAKFLDKPEFTLAFSANKQQPAKKRAVNIAKKNIVIKSAKKSKNSKKNRKKYV